MKKTQRLHHRWFVQFLGNPDLDNICEELSIIYPNESVAQHAGCTILVLDFGQYRSILIPKLNFTHTYIGLSKHGVLLQLSSEVSVSHWFGESDRFEIR